MPNFIGRSEELAILASVLNKKSASIVVIKGRRRIGKSRLIEEFAKKHQFDKHYFFSGIFPTKKTTAQSQRDNFASQLSEQTGLPEIKADDWNKLFLLLAEKIKTGKVVLSFDEISWMGSKDEDFLGKLKNAWDLHFKQNDNLVFILCGSISSWIEKNILGSTGFVGRVSLDLTLKELPLYDCNKFWGKQTDNISAYEKFKILAVTGGVPLYLEHINPALAAEENIKQLCFTPYGILYNEFEKIFSDMFSKRCPKYKKIIRYLSEHKATQDDISDCLGIKKSKNVSAYLDDLSKAGFITREYFWNIKNGALSNLSMYRLCDNYSRFYCKYIYPNRNQIENNQFMTSSLGNLTGWNSLMGLQFENLVLNNRRLLWKFLGINPEEIICDNPYFQRKSSDYSGCQIDYLIQMKFNSLYVCEIKFSKDIIKMNVVHEVQHKITNLAIPKKFSCRPILIHVNGVSDEVVDSGFFAAIIDFGKFLL